MGNKCCQSRKKRARQIVLLLVGLDNAGKTVAAKGLAGERLHSPIPTVGFSVIKLKYLDYNIKIFDLGGGPNIRGIWHKYFTDAHGVIFVIDSSDIERLNEARQVFKELVANEKISGKPVLFLANKNDQENALDEIDIIEFMNIEAVVNKYQCPTLVQSCSATENNRDSIDKGISNGYVWLMKYIARNFETLNSRVEEDVHEQELKERAEMLAKIRRIRELRELEQNQKDVDAIESYSEYARKLNGSALPTEDIAAAITSENTKSDSTSISSTDSFPPIYINSEVIMRRPRSAVQIIKHQLQLNETIKTPPKHRSNKTAPIHLYGMSKPQKVSQSAGERRKNYQKDRRSLKSADDSVFVISDKNVGPSGDFHKEIFQLNNVGSKRGTGKSNGTVHNHGDNNEICVVEVD